MSIGGRIKEIRGKISRDEFASPIGSTRNTIQRYETDQRKPTVEFIEALCTKYKIHSDWLIFGKEPKYWGQEAKQPQATPDREILFDAIDTIEQVLENTNKLMAPAAKAEVIIKIYELFQAEEQGTDKGKFSEILKLVANYG